jgi:hypothetical protein
VKYYLVRDSGIWEQGGNSIWCVTVGSGNRLVIVFGACQWDLGTVWFIGDGNRLIG